MKNIVNGLLLMMVPLVVWGNVELVSIFWSNPNSIILGSLFASIFILGGFFLIAEGIDEML